MRIRSSRLDIRPLLCAGAAAVLTLGAVPAAAQAPDGERGRVAGRGFFQVGFIRLGLDDLNTELQSAGFPSLNRDFLTLGGGGYGRRGDFLIGGEGHGLLGADETTPGGGRQLSTSGGYGLFRVGYLVLSSDALDVYPLLGVGGGGMSLAITERSAPTFDDVLNDPQSSSTLSTGMFLFDVAVAVNYRLELGERGRGSGGLLFGLQLGYTLAPGRTTWTLDKINSVAGGPAFQIEGPYVRLSIGGWGREVAEPESRAP